MLRLEKVTSKNVWPIRQLRVAEAQKYFVASNDTSIIEAYTTITENRHAFPFGIYDGDTPVGFTMIGFDYHSGWEEPPRIAKGNYLIWRLMIDEKYQRKGYGREALGLALDFVRLFPCGKAEYCWLSYLPENQAAKRLYQSFGFVETGEMEDNEIVAALRL